MADLPLDNNKMYYWRVTVNGGVLDGAKSMIHHFTTVPSVPVTMSLPNDASIVNMTDITFTGT